MKTLSYFLLLLLPACALAQDYKRTFNWCFSDSIGMSFYTNPPTISSVNIGKSEGSSTISDTNGNLLFYTNGVNVWNKNYQVMQNGTGLNGHISSTQAALIVPQPDNDSLFYIFTTDALGQSKGLQYSIVNMNADNGLGAVTTKNIPLQTPVCEKLAATHHQNGKDIWIVAHGFGNNTFFAYLITKDGLTSCPIKSNIGTVHSISNIVYAQGEMKFSNSGRILAATVFNPDDSKIDLFCFNITTGEVYNHIPISNVYLPFRLEFSRNSEHIYTTTRTNELITYKISSLNKDSIENSKTVIADYPNQHWILVGLQLSADSKVYVFYADSLHIGVINYPDSGGGKSSYIPFNISTGTRRICCGGGTNFISSYLSQATLEFTYSLNCNTRQAFFDIQNASSLNTLQWRIIKLANGTASFFNIKNFNYSFSDTGLYEVRLIADNDTATKTIFIEAPILPKSNVLGCGTDSVVLNVPTSYRCLQWGDTSATLYSRTIRTNGIYVLQGYNTQGCLVSDSVRINFTPTPAQPVITKNNDSLISSAAFSYQWYRNDTLIAGANLRGIKPVVAGLYKVMVTDSNGCSNISTGYSSNVGIHEQNYKSIKMYPNPASENIIVESDAEIESIILHNAIGRTAYEEFSIQKNSIKITCASFAKGIYFIQVKTNKTTYHKKLIIQ